MTNRQFAAHIKRTAKAERKAYLASFEKPKEADKIVDINWGLPYVGINLSNGQEYFFQEEAASEILEEATSAANKFNSSIDDVLLWQAQGWG